MYEVEQIERNLKSRGVTDLQTGEDGGAGSMFYKQTLFRFQYSWGLGWEHVSVSTQRRTPTWDEMCFFKDTFWKPGECAVQYHPAQDVYVNDHTYCLHIFRPTEETLPTPKKMMI